MLAAEKMLNALSKGEDVQDYKDDNSDHNFSEVLKVCGSNTSQKHKLRYFDGQEKYFTFDN